MRSQKWNRQHFGDHVKVHFLKFVVSRLQKRNVLVSIKLCGLAAGRATREALLSEAGFEKVFRTQNWVRRREAVLQMIWYLSFFLLSLVWPITL